MFLIALITLKETWSRNPFSVSLEILYIHHLKVLMCASEGQGKLQHREESSVFFCSLKSVLRCFCLEMWLTALASRGRYTGDCRLDTVTSCAILCCRLPPPNKVKTNWQKDPHRIYSFNVIIFKCVLFFAYILCYFYVSIVKCFFGSSKIV